MSSAEILDAPALPEPSPNEQKFDRERSAFYRLLPGLLERHEGQFVAVHNEQPVEFGNDQFDVAMAAYQRFGYVPIYVSRVTRDPKRPVRIPSPRRAG